MSIFDNMDAYKKKLVDANEGLPDEVNRLRDQLSQGRNDTDEPTKYKLDETSNTDDEESMMDRFSGRFNKDDSQQSEISDSDRLSQALTANNRTKRINDASDLATDKSSFNTYTNLFSKYIGNLNAETNVRKGRAASMEQSLDAVDRRIAKNEMIARKKKRAYERSFWAGLGKFTHLW